MLATLSITTDILSHTKGVGELEQLLASHAMHGKRRLGYLACLRLLTLLRFSCQKAAENPVVG